MKCPRCGGVLNEYGDLFVCEGCGAKFKNKSAQREQKQEEQVVQNTATESVIMPETKNESEKSELELLKERLAEMEKRQSEMESGGSHRNADFKGKFSQIKETKFFGFLKKWGLKVILPCVLAFIVLISLLVSLVGVRGVYYNVDNPNEFYSFSSSKYEYYGDFNGEEYVDKGTWKTKNGKLYLTYKDEEFGKQTDEYYFSKQSNKVIFIGEEKDSLSEFKRVTLSKYKPSSNKKVKITFDANGGSGDTSVSYSFGSKSKEIPQTEREGYFFKGWYKDKYGYKISGSKPYEEGKRVWEDVTYYANWWSDKTYTLTVEGTDIALELEEGDSILSKLKETEKGYTYDYYIYGELVDENTRMPANPVTISRQQTSVKTIKLTLNAVGGNFNGVGEITKTVAYNSDFTLDVPKSEGMFFAGYVIYPKNSEACISVATQNGSLTNDFWNNVYEDVTLYASWIDLATELADFEYTINDDGICITKYKGDKSTVEIPNGVVRLESQAFKKCTFLTSITIPASVKSIWSDAFYECDNLKTIFYIGDVASWCKISGLINIMSNNRTLYIGGKKVEGDLVIPDSVTSIGSSAFKGCTGLTSITIPNSVTSIGDSAFSGCTGLTSITIPNSVKSIGDFAFRDCTGLTSVTIPNSVTSIGDSAFQGCTGLTSATIGNSVTSIGNDAFEGCTGLTNITIPDSVTSIGNSAFEGCTGLTIVNWNATECTSAGSYNYPIFNGCSNLATVNIGDNVKIIPSYAFYNYTGLTSVTIGNSVTSIGWYAFSGCTGLTSVKIGNGVTSIGREAFAGCTGLTSITIPDSVTSIGYYAFSGCSGLKSINVSKNNSAYSSVDGILYDKNKTQIIHVPYAIQGAITVPDSVTSIGIGAFYGCSGLTNVTIGNSVTSFGYEAFRYCTGLTSITIPDSVKSIGDGAFQDCRGLTSVTISDSVTSIGKYAFVGCKLQDIYITDIAAWCNISGLNYLMGYGSRNKKLYINNELATSITIPNGVTAIPSSAFSGCSGLTSVTIGGSVTSIGESAFWGCTGLTSITIPNSVTSIGSYAFYGCSGLTTVNWNATECTSVGSGGYIFEGCSNLATVNIGDNVTIIPAKAFVGCTGLTSITIPDSVTSIGSSAFASCTGLTSIMFNGTKARWNAIKKGSNWKYKVPSTCKVICTDGDILI